MDRLKVNRDWLGIWFMLPAAAFLLLFLAYPLGLGIWLSFTDARIGRSGNFVGIENYVWLWDDSVFWLSVFNTLLYTSVASVFKFAIGLYLRPLQPAHAVQGDHPRDRADPVHRADRALGHRLLVVFDSQFSIVSWSCAWTVATNIDFLGDTWNARWSVIFANIWRGVPFVAITLLAGLQTVSPSLLRRRRSTARADGRFSAISLPCSRPSSR